jgi:glycine cleavage system H protein
MDRENHNPEFLETTIDKFIFRVATKCLYSRDGIWLLEAGDGRVQLGVTDYFQQRNGDVAFVHIKPSGTTLAAGEEFAELETIKANASLFAPTAGTLLEVNKALELSPETINESPYGKGWLTVLQAADWERDKEKLLDAQSYLSLIRSEAEREMAG